MSAASSTTDDLDASESGPRLRPGAEAELARAALVARLRCGATGDDLRGARLSGADLSGVDLSGRDMTGADLSRADLRGARLVGAGLASVDLSEAVLDDAELAGASLSSAILEGASALRAGFGRADLRRAAFFGAHLEGASFVEARLAHADLRRVHARGARFHEADLHGADLGQADLSDADLSKADVDHASFLEADLRRARLRSLRGFERASFLRADVRDVDFSGAYLLRRHVLDENYLEEFRTRGPAYAVAYWVWWATSDCGRSVARWTAWTLAIALAYGFAFQLVTMDYGGHETWLSPFYYSVVTLTTLGYGDVLPGSVGAQMLAMSEVILGYLMLGGVISIFSNKLARRGE
ncbi:MAG: pentapeptide repeat-containing protein [Myxococcales bacterium]|nr:pentapeptide repeat-containing protein [Myxococcales bacterium]